MNTVLLGIEQGLDRVDYRSPHARKVNQEKRGHAIKMHRFELYKRAS